MEEELDSNFKTVGNIRTEKPVIMNVEDCNVYYGDVHALKNVNMEIGKSEVLALIGPSGCGKSTFIRCLNRLNDTIDIARVTGKISLDGKKVILVPFFLVFPIFFKGFIEFPSLNLISYSFPSL